MIKLSASLIKDYLSCQKKGYYRINHPELSISTDEMIIGDVVHKVLENCWDKDKKTSIEYANYLLSKYNILDPTFKSIDKINRSITNFFGNFIYLLSKGDKIELNFEIPYLPNLGEVLIKGKIDRVNKDGCIFDWKTTLKIPKNIDNDIQFIVYYMSYITLYKEPPKKVFYASLISGKLIEFQPKSYYINYLYNNIIPSLIDDIKRGKFERTGLFNNSCLNCQFQVDCWKNL